jgi:hypothetical protein
MIQNTEAHDHATTAWSWTCAGLSKAIEVLGE